MMTDRIIALDVGTRRVGVATASLDTKIPSQHSTLEMSENIYDQIEKLMNENNASTIVIGLPRNLSGDDTAQTEYVRHFATRLNKYKIVFQDEALTSVKAKDELTAMGKPYTKGDIDSLAAVYILEDYFSEPGIDHV